MICLLIPLWRRHRFTSKQIASQLSLAAFLACCYPGSETYLPALGSYMTGVVQTGAFACLFLEMHVLPVDSDVRPSFSQWQ